MVVFLIRDPLVASAMDKLVAEEAAKGSLTTSSPSAGALSEGRTAFIRETIDKALTVMAPSVALDSLWVLLHLKRQFILAQAASDAGSVEAQAAARFGDWVLPCADILGYLDHLLLHERGAPLTVPAIDNATVSSSSASASAINARDVHSAVAVLDLALDVLAPSKPPSSTASSSSSTTTAPTAGTSEPRRSPSVLLQTPTLVLLIRDLETLWCWKYLLLQMHKRHLAKRRLLTREDDLALQDKRSHSRRDRLAGGGASEQKKGPLRRRDGAGHASQAVNGLPLDQFFHDYELLVPSALLALFATAVTPSRPAASLASGDHDAGHLHCVRRWLAALSAEASSATVQASRQAQVDRQQMHRPRPPVRTSDKTVEAPCSREATIVASLLLVPAVSPDNNPDRKLKNRRVDVIEAAAMNYFYKQLAGRGGGAEGKADGATQSGVPQRIAVDGAGDILDEVQLAQNDVAYGRRRVDDAEKAESFASFMRNASIGLDIHLMSLTGAAVGYYVGHVRGLATEMCVLYAVIGLVVMLFVDATLLIIRLGRHDEGVVKQKQKASRARARLGIAQRQHMDSAKGVTAQLAAMTAGGGASADTASAPDEAVPEDGKLKKD